MTSARRPRDGSEANGLPVSLRTLFAGVFVAACMSRWLARFGLGLAVPIFWCIAVGAATGALVSFVGAVGRWLNSWSGKCFAVTALNLRRIFAPVTAGAVGGALAGAVGFDYAAVAGIDRVSAHGLAFTATMFGSGGNPVPMPTFAGCLLIPAFVGALAASIARSLAAEDVPALPLVLSTALVLGISLAIIPPLLITVWLLYFPPARPPAGGWHENMLGLLPIGVAIWCIVFACVGAMAGALAGGACAWIVQARRSTLSRALLWCATIACVLIVTEAALRGWVGATLK
jgi:hypothetical protein